MEKYSHSHLRLTPQRIAILDYLEGNKSHPSAEDIYRAVVKKFPTVSLATVYNTLSALERRGQLLKLTIDPSKARYDPNTSPHHHLICNLCKTIVDVDARYRLPLPDTDFKVTGSHVEFYGTCQKCRKTSRETGN
ncbi:MAG TPA: transcriptional repressor [Thermodesulfobacteriota bacterium]|nr:transcriptional repressor [Thermodesulfobacteriota bacterium]